MQVDMHYYGTYAMARAAGLSPADCRIIAIAAQFVDDNAGKDTIWFLITTQAKRNLSSRSGIGGVLSAT